MHYCATCKSCKTCGPRHCRSHLAQRLSPGDSLSSKRVLRCRHYCSGGDVGSQSQEIRTVVFPVAGRGTRFLPATKASPKEMLPVVDKPLIQYAAEEALAAGARKLVFIT